MNDFISNINDYIENLFKFNGDLESSPSVKTFVDTLSISKIFYTIFINGEAADNIVILDTNCSSSSNNYFYERKTSNDSLRIVLRVSCSSNSSELSSNDKNLLDIFSNSLLNVICIKRLLSSREHAFYYNETSGITNANAFELNFNNVKQSRNIYDYYIGIINIKSCHTLNTLFGNDTTVKMIREYAQTLLSRCDLSLNELVSHFGSDTFALLIHKSNIDSFVESVKSIHISIENTYDTIEYDISCRAGFIKIISDYEDYPHAIDKAMITFKKTRNNNQNDTLILNDASEHGRVFDQSMVNDFINDINSGNLLVYYQPIFKYDDELTIVSAEALVRWRRHGEMVSPADFIPLAESINLISQLDLFVLRTVCEKIKEWTNNGIKVVPITVNFSHHDLHNQNIAKEIISIIDSYEIDHELITIEFKEVGYHEEYMSMLYTVSMLHENKILVGIDNYGAGYSSLGLLSNLDFNTIKISSQFVNSNNDKGLTIMNYLTNMCNSLNVKLICQGIEDNELIEEIKKQGCKYFQADYFSKALSERFFVNKLKNQ